MKTTLRPNDPVWVISFCAYGGGKRMSFHRRFSRGKSPMSMLEFVHEKQFSISVQ